MGLSPHLQLPGSSGLEAGPDPVRPGSAAVLSLRGSCHEGAGGHTRMARQAQGG